MFKCYNVFYTPPCKTVNHYSECLRDLHTKVYYSEMHYSKCIKCMQLTNKESV